MDFTNLDRALDDFGTRVIDEMQNILFEKNNVNTGDLARSITSDIISTQQGEAIRVSLLWYGKLLEDGGPSRGPGRIPPIRPIEGWIKRKKIPVPAKFKSPKSFAFAIARSIGKKGPKYFPQYPKTKVIEEGIRNAAANFGNEAIMKAVENDIILSINDSVESAGVTVT